MKCAQHSAQMLDALAEERGQLSNMPLGPCPPLPHQSGVYPDPITTPKITILSRICIHVSTMEQDDHYMHDAYLAIATAQSKPAEVI